MFLSGVRNAVRQILVLRRKTQRHVKQVSQLASLCVRGEKPIVVYQMGKVGSTSVYKSLISHGLRAIQAHNISIDRHPQKRKAYIRLSPLQRPFRVLFERVTFLRRVIMYTYFSREKRGLKIITLVREPVARNISAFFETFEMGTGGTYVPSDVSREELSLMFLKYYPHEIPLNWFDDEIRQVFGIDVYDHPFPQEKGFLTIKEKNVEILILKSEIEDRMKEHAISRFLNVSDFKLTRAYAAEDKDYAETYQRFKQTVELPQEYIETMCNAKYTRHFYSEAEIQHIRAKWQKDAPMKD